MLTGLSSCLAPRWSNRPMENNEKVRLAVSIHQALDQWTRWDWDEWFHVDGHGYKYRNVEEMEAAHPPPRAQDTIRGWADQCAQAATRANQFGTKALQAIAQGNAKRARALIRQALAEEARYRDTTPVWGPVADEMAQYAKQPKRDSPPACGDCGAPMHQRRSRYGYFFGCSRYPECKGNLGCSPDGTPLGTPGDARTREARRRAHHLFDKLWKSGLVTGGRRGAYVWLKRTLGMSKKQAHIAKMNIQQCEAVVAAAKEFLAETGHQGD